MTSNLSYAIQDAKVTYIGVSAKNKRQRFRVSASDGTAIKATMLKFSTRFLGSAQVKQ